MPNNSLSDIRTAIQGILGTVAQIQSLNLGRSVAITGFPACAVYLSGVSEELEDNKPTFYRTYVFLIEISQELMNKDRTAAEQDFQDCVQAVLDAFNTNPYLTYSGTKYADDVTMDGGKVIQGEFYWGIGCQMTLSLTVKTLVG